MRDLIKANISPPSIHFDFIEFFISGNAKNVLISNSKKVGYDRNILLKINYEPGVVYEIKKDFGNPQMGVPFYTKGTSFYRDGSYTHLMSEDIRKLIRKNRLD